MNILVCVIPLCALIIAQVCSQDIFSTELQQCNFHKNIVEDYQNYMYDFAAQLFKNVGLDVFKNNFVLFPLSAWVILAAITEGADPATKQFMLQFLRLPDDPCIRLKYYQLVTSRFVSNEDVNITNRRVLVIDEGVTVSPTYHNFLFKNSLLDVVSAPMRSDPRAALEEMRRVASGQLTNLDLSGNSVILDAVDYNGLWTTAFEDAVIERSPFYSTTGEQIGTVDLMRVTRRARITYIKDLNMKGLELPVGHNGRYRMMIGIVLDGSTTRTINLIKGTLIEEFLNSLEENYKPIDIAIPRMNITSEYDVRKILETFGVNNIWTDPKVTEYISNPAALPSGFVHRSSLSIDTAGLEPAPISSHYNISADLDPTSRQNFIANRPFFMGLFDAETYTSIMAVGFINPTYPL